MTRAASLAQWSGCLLLCVAGCGGSARPSSAPESPGESRDADSAPEMQYQQAPAGYPGAGGYAQPAEPPAAGTDAIRTLEGAWDSFEAAATELNQAGPDCRLACKALSSMRRSTERICAMSESDGSEHCVRAKRRLQDAEKRVESSCSCNETP